MPPLDLSLPHSATHDAYRTWSNAQRDSGEHLRTWREARFSSARAEAFVLLPLGARPRRAGRRRSWSASSRAASPRERSR